MIATIVRVAKELARFEAKRLGVGEEQTVLHRLCKKPAEDKDSVRVAVIDITKKEVRLEDYKDAERFKYLYALSTGGHAVGPSWFLRLPKQEEARVTTGTKSKNSREEVVRSGLREIVNGLKTVEAPHTVLEDLEKWQKEDLVKQVLECVKGEKSVLLAVSWYGKMPGEHSEVVEKFCQNRIFGGSRAESKGSGRCGICGTENEVSSAIPFRFFTVEDKPAFYSFGRFMDAWRYAGVCKDCAKWLCVGLSYLDENLSTRVAGQNAFLLPDLEPNPADIKGSFVHFLWEWRERTQGRMAPSDDFPLEENDISESGENLFAGLVDELDRRFRDRPPFRSASLVFYQPGRKFVLLYTVSEILPKNLRLSKKALLRLGEVLREGALGSIGNWTVSQLKSDFEFVGKAWRWPHTGQTQTKGTLRLSPFHIVEAILTRRTLPEKEFWCDADDILRALYQRTISDGKQSVRKSVSDRIVLLWATWALVYHLETLIGGGCMNENTSANYETTKTLQNFWEAFFRPKLVLDNASKRGAFLVGVLFGEVERRQRNEREGSTGEMPIVSRLRGMTISGDEILKKLLPELMIKLRQLSANTKAMRIIQEAASDFASQGEGLSDEEARFCFCLGWALSASTVGKVREELGESVEEADEEQASGEDDESVADR
jgi:hypothetical protein